MSPIHAGTHRTDEGWKVSDVGEHRWLGYEPVVGDSFVAVCSCGWSSPPQRTAGLAGALVDAHREEASRSSTEGEEEERERDGEAA